MIRAIIVSTLVQRLKSPVRMALALLAFFFPLLGVTLMPPMGLAALGNGFFFAVIFAAGMIGQELSAGVLQLVFSRPVRRSEYVLSRWFACALLATTVASIQITLGAVILSLRGFPPETTATLTAIGTQALAAIGGVSVFTFFSSLLGGLGDLALFAMFNVIGGGFQLWGGGTSNRILARIGEELVRFAQPQIDVAQLTRGADLPVFAIVSYASTITLCLALAILRVNRRELSYASSS